MKSRSSRQKRVAIIGTGLMGGSLGWALRRSRRWRVVGIGRRAASLTQAKKRGCLDTATTNLKQGVAQADVVIVAVPVSQIVSTLKKIHRLIPPHCLVMDVGSVKESIVREADKIFGKGANGPWFVGAHPMAGSEKTGPQNVQKDLYKKAPCILTPTAKTNGEALQKAAAFWKSVGCRVERLSPQEHDHWVAFISHLPHLLADALVLTAAGQKNAQRWVRALAAGSFRDTTRIAGADPRQWREIFRYNRRALEKASALFQKNLNSLKKSQYSLSKITSSQKWRKKFFPLAR